MQFPRSFGSGNPGTGRSVITGHVIKFLQRCGADHSYYFFKHNDIGGSNVSTLLRSLACQMAATNLIIGKHL